ncbi:MAG: alpha/beta fold hydrolase [Chloroflexaceae bacterium]|nr:alpha/beta fold hydrolase [Chloroflexaceae bacterium]
MSSFIETTDTAWLDRTEYPFAPHFFDVPEGRLHYVDEGQGQPIVMVHGTPSWSFLYRHLIKGLAADYRCIAPDNLGFGLSDKPPRYSYRPSELAQHLHMLINQLDLHDIVLMVHDFGGPIGLSYALAHPERVRALVIFNSWLWSLKHIPAIRVGSALLSSPVGRWLNRVTNFDPRVIIPSATADKSKLTPLVRRHYAQPFPRPQDRNAPVALARELVASGDWYESLGAQRERIRHLPTLIVWGMADPLLTSSLFLERWKQDFRHAEFVLLSNTGHFVPEERRAELVPIVRTFLQGVPITSDHS